MAGCAATRGVRPLFQDFGGLFAGDRSGLASTANLDAKFCGSERHALEAQLEAQRVLATTNLARRGKADFAREYFRPLGERRCSAFESQFVAIRNGQRHVENRLCALVRYQNLIGRVAATLTGSAVSATVTSSGVWFSVAAATASLSGPAISRHASSATGARPVPLTVTRLHFGAFRASR